MLTVACPNCGRPVPWAPDSRHRPFCGERCRQIDLGAWANEEYRVAGEAPPDDFSIPDLPPMPRE